MSRAPKACCSSCAHSLEDALTKLVTAGGKITLRKRDKLYDELAEQGFVKRTKTKGGWRYATTDAAYQVRSPNPRFRYGVVPVDSNDDGTIDTAYVARSRSRKGAIRDVANEVDDDAVISVGRTRMVPTKHGAIARAHDMAPEVRVLARRLARGQSR